MSFARASTALAGAAAESIAARHLERAGLRILERNYRCRGGEIDLVAAAGDTLVFVEVRLRANADFGGAAASIDAAKRRRIVLAARHYLARDPDRAARFDVVLLADRAGRRLEWIQDAFGE